MRARALLAACAVACAVPVAATRASASTPLCPTPSVSGVSPVVAAPGATVTLSGSSFTAVGCTLSVQVGPATIAGPTVQNGAVTFVAGAGDSGAVQVTLTDSANNANQSNTNLALYVPPSVTSVSPRTPAVGQAVTLSGSGFDLHLPAGDEQLRAAYLNADGSTCSTATAALVSDTGVRVSGPARFCDGPLALGVSAPADLGNASASATTVAALRPATVDVSATVNGLNDDVPAGATISVNGSGLGTGGTAAVGGAPAATSSWSDTGVVVTVPDSAVTGATVTLTRAADGAAMTPPGALHVAARVDGVSPSSVTAGGAVTIVGGGFGPHPGTVSLGPLSLPVSSWTPTAVRVTVPGGAASGTLALTPVDTEAPATHPALTVVQQPHVAGVSPAQLQQVTAALSAPPAPVAPPRVGGVPPPLPVRPVHDGPVVLTLQSPATGGAAGASIAFTATLVAYGRPVANAPVQLQVVYEPGSDGAVTPQTAVTDANGAVHGFIHLSRTPGTMIVLAQSGQATDELRLLGTATLASAAGGPGSPARPGFPLGLLLLAALLAATGFGLRQGVALLGEHRRPG